MDFTYSLMSDMHVDFPQPKTPYDLLEKNVIVAGDTSNGLEGLKFLNKLQRKEFNVYACEGNHEHYSNQARGRTHTETTERFREEFPIVTDIDDRLTLVCVNGWYDVKAPFMWFNYMNDCRRGFGEDPNSGAYEVRRLLEMQAASLHELLESSPDRKFIVTTHTAPCEETLDPRFDGVASNEWYWSPRMRNVLRNHADKILAWNHGHTHFPNEAVVDGVRVICNPRGYPGENPDWRPKTVTVTY